MPGAERVVLEPPVSTKVPSSGPPVEFFRSYGYTAGCTACDNIEHGKRGSRVHNQACRRRYAMWMFDQIGPEGAPLAVAPEWLEELEPAPQVPPQASASSGVP